MNKLDYKKAYPFLAVTALTVGVIVAYNRYKKISNKVTDIFSGEEDEKELAEKIEVEQKKLSEKGEVLSYPIYQYKSFAQTLKNAMGGMGTDEDEMYKVFSKMKNDLDVSELYKQFGTAIYAVSAVRYLYLDLGQWINQELNKKELAKLNKILADNNITYKF